MSQATCTYSIDALHTKVLGILKAVHGVCREHGLHYYIWAGTMIGAVRHKGFIPWDDDLDIAMPRRDYDLLVAHAKEWSYFSHQEGGQLNHRFLTPSFCKKYTEKFGQEFDQRYMLYFVYGASYETGTTRAVRNVQYVMGETPEDIHKTYLLRDRYYKMLNHGVVDLFKDAKAYAEKLYGKEFPTGAHASWAESPTIDDWDTEKMKEYGHPIYVISDEPYRELVYDGKTTPTVSISSWQYPTTNWFSISTATT